MICYIKNTPTGIYLQGNETSRAHSALGVIKELCRKHLFELEGYLESTKLILNIKYKIPIYISNQLVFFYLSGLREFETIFINYRAIKNVVFLAQKTQIEFLDGSSLLLEISKRVYQKMIIVVKQVINYKNSLVWIHFHFVSNGKVFIVWYNVMWKNDNK